MNTTHKAKGFRFFLLITLLANLVAGVEAADQSINKAPEINTEAKPVIAPPANWVKPQFYDRQSLLLKTDAGADQHWLLIERQINAATDETFFHCSRQILNVSGVQNGSNLKIDFNPSYQTLTLHWVRLWRGTNHLDQLAVDKVRVVRQERDIDQQILNGEQTAMLVLDGVRVGDIVDYAYSAQGENPVFNGKFSAMLPVQLAEPIERLLTRVTWPAQRRFYPKTYGVALQPVVVTKTNMIECVWDQRHVSGLALEDMLPVWCDPEPWVQLSEFKNWAEVNQWALELFQNNSSFSAELSQKIAEWKQLGSREQQVLAALKFVQDEIRYFGIEIGVSANKPADPSTVFTRRFGDCKDKSLLFVNVMRSLGMEAYPVLVNTQARQTIQDWLPAAGIFDHCIAVVRLDGQTWWLDPTAGYQRGTLAGHYLPAYGRGLVIAPGTTALATIPQTTGLPLTTTTEYFDLGRKSGATDLKVVTVAEGRDADQMRAMFASTKRTDIEKSFIHLYSDAYPGIQMAAPIEVQDDESANRFQTTETYTIDKAWVKSDSGNNYLCKFYPSTIAACIMKPQDTHRKYPLAVAFPQHQILRTEITVPVSLSYPGENKQIEDSAFTLRKQTRRNGRKLVIEYDFQTYADSVSAGRTDEYLDNLNKVAKCFGDGIVWH